MIGIEMSKPLTSNGASARFGVERDFDGRYTITLSVGMDKAQLSGLDRDQIDKVREEITEVLEELDWV